MNLFKKTKSIIPHKDQIKAAKKRLEAAQIEYQAAISAVANDILTDKDVIETKRSAIKAVQNARRALSKHIPTATDMKHKVADSLINVAKKLES